MINEELPSLKPRKLGLQRLAKGLVPFLALATAAVLSACGGGSDAPASTNSSTTVTITGTLSHLAKAKPSVNTSAATRAAAAIAWARATLQVIDSSGTVIGTGTVNADGTYTISVAPGSNYFIRVQSGNLVLKAFVPTVLAGATVNVTPTTTAEVMVLAQVLGVANIGEKGVNASPALSTVKVDVVMTQITANPNIAALATVLAANIDANYNANASTSSIGSADTTVSSSVANISTAISTTAIPAAIPAAPSTPTGIGITAGDGQALLTWTAVTGATSYNVYYRTSANVSTANGTKVANATSGAAITGLTNGTTYYFVVTAVNAGGASAVSSEVSATPQVPAPAAPTGVSATPGDALATVSWAASTGAASYNIYYRTTPGVTAANGTKVTGATSPKTITGLTNGVIHYFVVTAVGAGGESATSTEVFAKPASPGAWTTKTSMVNQRDNAANAVVNGIVYVLGGAPAGVSILDSMEAYDPATNTWTTKAIMPVWSVAPAALAYRYGPAAAPINGLIYLIGGTSLVNGQGPIYPVAVYNTSANTWSTVVPNTAATTTAGTAGQTLAPFPTGRWGFDVAVVDGIIYAVGGAVQVPGGTTKANGTKITGATSGVALAPATPFTNGKTYYFIVTAVNAGVESAASFEVSVTPQASYAAGSVPANLSTIAGSGQATISWTAVTGATSYNVYYGTKSGVTSSSLTKVTGIAAPTVTSTVTSLTNGTAYYFIVTAVVGGAETVASSEASATPQATPSTVTVPSGVAITGGNAQVTLTWTAPSGGATSYNVYYGAGVNIYYGTVEAYDPVLNTWTTKATMPTLRYGSTVSVVNGLIYAIGGWGGWPELSVVEVYNPATNTWSTTVPVNTATTALGTAGAALAPMPTARDDFGFGVVNGVIYAIGGDINAFNNATSTPCCTTIVEAYDTVTNKWSTKTSMPTMRDDFDASVVNGVIYAIAGSRDGVFTTVPTPANNGGYSLTTNEAFNISSIPVPGGVTATATGTQVALGWSAAAGATSYNIYWSNKAGVSTAANSTKIATGTALTYTHTGLTVGTWYYYAVTAVTASGESPPSNEVAVKP